VILETLLEFLLWDAIAAGRTLCMLHSLLLPQKALFCYSMGSLQERPDGLIAHISYRNSDKTR
jgi:hypothetical protein